MTIKKVDYKKAKLLINQNTPTLDFNNFPPLNWETHQQGKLRDLEQQINILKIENNKNNTILSEIKQAFSNVSNRPEENDVILLKIADLIKN